jgi:muramoyltetrapeptide carboxypeptidase
MLSSMIDRNSLRVTSPAGRVLDQARMAAASEYFQARGWKVHADETTQDEGFQRFGADDATRLSCLHAAAKSDARLVVTARGGYGISRLLDQVDYNALKTSEIAGQRWVGYSDITALHLAGLAKVGWKSIAGACFSEEWADAPPHQFTQDSFWGLVNEPSHSVTFEPSSTCGLSTSQNQQGSWAGTLWGGNLAIVNHLLGTPYLPEVANGILFLEDINEQPFRIERRLLQLLHAGVLDQQSAVLLGDFGGYTLGAHERGFSLQEAVNHVQARTKTPILTGLPFGHCKGKLALPVGGHCELQSHTEGGAPRISMRFSRY